MEHVSHFDICLNFFFFFIFLTLFFDIFSNFPSTQTIEVIDLIFFNELTLKNWAMNMHFNSIPILKGRLQGGRGTPPPSAIHRLRPLSLYKVNILEISRRN